MADNDGVYVSQRRRVQRRKKVVVAIAGLVAVVGGGAYGITAWQTAQDTTTTGDTGALAPIVTPGTEPPSPSGSGSSRPSPRVTKARIFGVPRSSRPSPTPSAAAVDDGEVASAQVSHLLRVPRATPSGGLSAAGERDTTITVTNESPPDGSSVRVLAARYDLTGGGTALGAADTGHPIGNAHCTQNLLVDKVPQVRPSMMLCWRATATRSVVTIATSTLGRPSAATGAAIIDRAWLRLG